MTRLARGSSGKKKEHKLELLGVRISPGLLRSERVGGQKLGMSPETEGSQTFGGQGDPGTFAGKPPAAPENSRNRYVFNFWPLVVEVLSAS